VTVTSRCQRNKPELYVPRRTRNAPTCLYSEEWPLVEALKSAHMSLNAAFYINSLKSCLDTINIRGCPTLRNDAPIPPRAVGKHTTAVRTRSRAEQLRQSAASRGGDTRTPFSGSTRIEPSSPPAFIFKHYSKRRGRGESTYWT